jgi:hypothetical protein
MIMMTMSAMVVIAVTMIAMAVVVTMVMAVPRMVVTVRCAHPRPLEDVGRKKKKPPAQRGKSAGGFEP